MPRKKTARRSTPRNAIVSQAIVDDEAKYLAREVDDLLISSTADLRRFLDERYDLAVKSWQAAQEAITKLPARDAEALRAILFRDIFHLLECCRSFLRSHVPEGGMKVAADPVAEERHDKFSEWLFESPHES